MNERLRRLAPLSGVLFVGLVIVAFAALGQTLPLLDRQIAEERSVEPPPEIAARVEHAFALRDESVRDLKESRRKALAGDVRGALTAFAKFIQGRDRARQAADALGFRC